MKSEKWKNCFRYIKLTTQLSFSFDELPGEVGEETLQCGDGKVGPGKLGDGGAEEESDDHQEDKEDE